MIASLRGTLISKSPTELLVEVSGVGYSVSIPLSTYEQIGTIDSTVTLLTYLHVREDALQLYGFSTEDERSIFKLLISVSGIGPKMAQSILSGVSVADLKNHVTAGNLGALTAIHGIGRKIGERLVVELREKIGKLVVSPAVPGAATDTQTRARDEALLALTSLGYHRTAAEKALRVAIQEINDKNATVEGLIKAALRHAAK